MEDNFYDKNLWPKPCIAKDKIFGFENDLKMHGRSENTIFRYRGIIKLFFVDFLKDKPVEEVSLEDITGFISWKINLEKERHQKNLTGRGNGRLSVIKGQLNPRTINANLSPLKKYFLFCKRIDLVENIEFAKVKSWKPPVFEIDLKKIVDLFKSKNLAELEELTRKTLAKKSVDKLTGKETTKVVDEYYIKRNTLLFYLLFNTGIRIGESANLTTQSFKFDLAVPVMMVTGKTGERTIPLSPDVAEKLKSFIKAYNIQGKLFASNTTPKVGLSVNTMKTYIWRMFRIGLGEQYHAHTLRHAYITFCINKGVPMRPISNNVGHSSIAMTSVYYDSIKGQNQVPISPIDFIETK